MNDISSNKRIAKNALLLYFRMIITMLVTLFTSRIILETLGVEDFGIYCVVAGIVAIMGFLNSSMTTTTQRYITYELGKDNYKRLRLVFNSCFWILGILSVIIIIVSESFGLWLLYHKMQIPAHRMYAAVWAFQCSILTAVISIMSVPYNAIIIAYERMSVFAYISLLEVVLKLGIVYILIVSPFDKLIMYSILFVLVQLFICVLYILYCLKKFPETKCMFVFYRPLIIELSYYTGWNFFGNLAGVAYTQGLNILLNIFFGPVVNAARGISVQVQNAVAQFSNNFQMAVNPQITKSYAIGDYISMHRLVGFSCKYTFFLMLLISLPVLIETKIILALWLKVVPDYTVEFLRLMIVITIIDAISNPLMVAITSTGKVKIYQTVIGVILLSILPLSYVVLKWGGVPSSVFIVHLSLNIIAFMVRIYLARSLIKLDIKDFLFKIVGRCILVAFIAILLPLFYSLVFTHDFLTFCFSCVLSFVSVLVTVFFAGLNSSERYFIKSKFYALYIRMKNK